MCCARVVQSDIIIPTKEFIAQHPDFFKIVRAGEDKNTTTYVAAPAQPGRRRQLLASDVPDDLPALIIPTKEFIAQHPDFFKAVRAGEDQNTTTYV